MPEASEFGQVRFVSRQGERLYQNPEAIVTAASPGEVAPALECLRTAVQSGWHAAGYLAYEAAPAFEPRLTTHSPSGIPLLWFGLYRAPAWLDPRPAPCRGAFHVGDWDPLVPEAEYHEAIARIRAYIAAGDAYQVNYTFPLRAPFEGNPLDWFRQLTAAQGGDHGAYVDAGRFQVLSASPELFFELRDGSAAARPMKGTRPRGLWPAQDRAMAGALRESQKDRAENVMIVDLLRNDLGRIAATGTVEAPSLFDVERYETVWQMTSTVTAKTDGDAADLLGALFPSGSVTGAPKIRAMEIIRELEPYPRGVYCGTIGWWAPGPEARFNVAIRTVTVHPAKQRAEYHTGGGITWDSRSEAEFQECRAKAALLVRKPAAFQLLESLLFDGAAFWLLDEHLRRLEESAAYFGVTCRWADLRAELTDMAERLRGKGPRKVRLLLDREGAWTLEDGPAPPADPISVGLAPAPIDPDNVFLYHKTTERSVYEKALAARPDCGDVFLWNFKGELTESTRANLVLELDGKLVTPPVVCGLLAGVYRDALLREGTIVEGVVHKEDLSRAGRLWLINSVRGWMEALLLDAKPL